MADLMHLIKEASIAIPTSDGGVLMIDQSGKRKVVKNNEISAAMLLNSLHSDKSRLDLLDDIRLSKIIGGLGALGVGLFTHHQMSKVPPIPQWPGLSVARNVGAGLAAALPAYYLFKDIASPLP